MFLCSHQYMLLTRFVFMSVIVFFEIPAIVMLQSNSLQTKILRVGCPGGLPVCWGSSPLKPKILIK